MQKKPLEQEIPENPKVRTPDNHKDHNLPGTPRPDEINLKEQADEEKILKENIKNYNKEIGKNIEEDKDRETGANKTAGKFKTPQDLE